VSHDAPPAVFLATDFRRTRRTTSNVSMSLPTIRVPFVPIDPDFLAMIFHGIDDPVDSGNRQKAYEPPEDEDETLARRYWQARVLDSLAYILVSQAEKDVVAVGVVVTNSGSSQPGDSDSDTGSGSGSERSPPTIEVLVANNNVIGENTCKYLENVLESLREIRKANPGIKGSSRLPTGAILMDTTETHGKLFVKLELSILERVWPKLRQRYKKSNRDTTFLDVLKYIQGDCACTTRMDIPEDLRLVFNPPKSF